MRESIDAKTYFEAALEHVESSGLLYREQRYALSFYAAGLSVECIFRAFIGKSTRIFDEKHDLSKLYKNSKFAEMVAVSEAVELKRALSEVMSRWSNVHRFRSEDAIKRFLKKEQLDRRIKGDYLKENCRLIVVAAFTIVNRGSVLWKNS